MCIYIQGLPRWLVKSLFAKTGDMGLISGSGRSPGERMATHSSILAWKIPWTKEPGRLQSMGSQSRTRLSDFTSSLHLLITHTLSSRHPAKCLPCVISFNPSKQVRTSWVRYSFMKPEKAQGNKVTSLSICTLIAEPTLNRCTPHNLKNKGLSAR